MALIHIVMMTCGGGTVTQHIFQSAFVCKVYTVALSVYKLVFLVCLNTAGSE